MALRDLLNVEMAEVSAGLLGGELGVALEADTSLTEELAEVKAAHEAITALIEPHDDPEEREIVRLTDLLGVIDHRADEVYQASASLAQCGAALLHAGAQRERLVEATRAALTRTNAEIINAPYEQAPAEAAALRARLTPQVRAALDVVRVGDVSLVDGLDEWIRLSEQIGELEAKRLKLLEQRSRKLLPREEIVARRGRWVLAVQRLFDRLPASALTPEQRARVVARAHELEREAAQRRGRLG